jgi:hypothetical protein
VQLVGTQGEHDLRYAVPRGISHGARPAMVDDEVDVAQQPSLRQPPFDAYVGWLRTQVLGIEVRSDRCHHGSGQAVQRRQDPVEEVAGFERKDGAQGQIDDRLLSEIAPPSWQWFGVGKNRARIERVGAVDCSQ